MNYITVESELGFHQEWVQPSSPTWPTGIHWTFSLHTSQIIKGEKKISRNVSSHRQLPSQSRAEKILQSYVVKKLRQAREREKAECLLINGSLVRWGIRKKKFEQCFYDFYISRFGIHTNRVETSVEICSKQSKSPSDVYTCLHPFQL